MRFQFVVFNILSCAWLALAPPLLPNQDANISSDPDESYLKWTMKQAEELAKNAQKYFRVGNMWKPRDGSDNPYTYRVLATWFTPDVIRIAARIMQLGQRLSDSQTRALVTQAEAAGDTVVRIEIDPFEGSGVIPLEWEAYLGVKKKGETESGGVAGTKKAELRNVKVLGGVGPRNYAFDRFWLVFPLCDEEGNLLLPTTATECELVVRIGNKEGRTSWKIPESIRLRSIALASKRKTGRFHIDLMRFSSN